MADHVHYIPTGFTAVSPYITVKDVAQAIDFYKQSFGATETFRMAGLNGRVNHAQLDIDGSAISLASPENFDENAPHSLISLFLYVADVDQVVERAVKAGAILLSKPEDQLYGDRNGGITDPFGITWWVATHIEDVSPDEVDRRAAAIAVPA